MASALAGIANATATFEVAGTGVVTDPETGNVSPVADTVAVTLYLKAGRAAGTALPGVDTLDTIYDGYAVDPTALDPRIAVGTTGSLSFAGEDAAPCEVLALRLPYGATGTIGGALASVLGQSIQLRALAQS